MYSPKTEKSCPSDFNFPYTPYNIQQQMMQELYQVLENKQIGIFESPTGTGKSLTLTCAALKWVEDHEKLVRQEMQQRLEDVQNEVLKLEKESQEVSDWITLHSKTSHQRRELLELSELKKLLDVFEEKLNEIRSKRTALKKIRSKCIKLNQDDDQNTADIQYDLNDLVEDANPEENNDDYNLKSKDKEYREVQVFFCSRTHTQLSQVVREIKRTAYGERVRCISLASRQQLCIHKELKTLNNGALINEKCLDMAKNPSANVKPTCYDKEGCVQKKVKISENHTLNTMSKCEFKVKKKIQNLTEISLTDILDIEDIVKEGENINACPYYAARNATQLAQIVMLPYQILLHKKTRQQSGINLKGSVVIIDEAHNLLDTISQMHSCQLSLQQLQNAHSQLLSYKMKYISLFNSSNLLSINQLLFVVKSLIKILESPIDKNPSKPFVRMLYTYELMSEGDFFNIDLHKLLNFCEKSRLAQKLQSFAKSLSIPSLPKSAAVNLLQRLQKDHIEKNRKPIEIEQVHSNAENQQTSNLKNLFPVTSNLRPLISFLEALCENAADGRVLINKEEKCVNNEFQTGFKYIHLNPGTHFEEIVKDARAIIVAGGTMQPTSELTEQLFHASRDRVQLRFYNHVVPEDAVTTFVVTKSPGGRNLCFNYAQRSSDSMLLDLCAVLENLCNVVPAGLVCFLPSYDYLNEVYRYLQGSGVLHRISRKKKVFKEPRNMSNDDFGHVGSTGESNQTVEQLLNDYAKAIKGNSGGALLLSVVGAKLSEGLNFADDLGRGIVVVGLPYPNRNSPTLQERMSYLDSNLGPGSGSEYYENLCIKAVNQCIGRSVRHIRDYACVYLLDERYSRKNIQCKLPQWISRNIKIAYNYGHVQRDTAKFFKQKREKI